MGLLTKWGFWIVLIIIILVFFFVPLNPCQSIELGADGVPTGGSVTTYISYFNYLSTGGVCPQ